MSRKKRFAAVLLCALLLTGITQSDTAYAASPSLSASADTAGAAAGEYVTVSVTLSGNPEISTLGASLNYDSSVLKYDSCTWNGSFSESDMKMASDTGSQVNLSVVCDDSYAADGTVAAVRFQAVKDTSTIPVTLSLRSMADADLSEISGCAVAGTVSVPKTPEPETPKNETEEVEDAEKSSDIRVVDEEAGAENQPEAAAPDTADNTKNVSNVSAGVTQNTSETVSSTQTASQGTQTSRPDANYQTGIGLESDILLYGAAAFGILALILAVRHHKEEKR